MKKTTKYILFGFGGILLILALINFGYLRTFTFSSLITPILLLCMSAVPLLAVLCEDKIKELREKKVFKILFNTVVGVYAAGLVFIAVMGTVMVCASAPDEVPENATAVVLGANTINDKPSHQLAERLDAAYEYLTENPGAMCIVTGGKQANCTLAQGTIMKNYLVDKGISPDRIIEENEAWDTHENMIFSKKIMDEKNLGTDIALVTSEYHQYRSQIRARQQGFTPYCVPSRTGYWWTLPQSYLREMIGIIEYWILG